MASAKKNKKKKVVLSLGEFLGDEAAQVVTTKSWADEMEKELDADDSEYNAPKVVINRAVLPTAPRASRGADVDMSQVPTEPPFTAYVGNLPFDASAEDVERFFKGLKVVGVRLPSDSGRAKGFGYAEFEDRQSLVDALAMTDSTMRNRQIRVDLASHGQDRDRRDGDRDHRHGDREEGDDKTLGDWRRKDESGGGSSGGGRDRRDDFDRDRPSYDRESRGDRFGGDRGERREGYRFNDRDRGGRNDDRGGRYDDRGGGGGRFDDFDRGRDRDDHGGRSYGGFRDRDRDRDRSDRYGPPRDRFERNGDRFGGRDRDGGGGGTSGRSDREWTRDGEKFRESDDRSSRDTRERYRDDDRFRDGSDRPTRDGNRDWPREGGGEERSRDAGDRYRDVDRGGHRSSDTIRGGEPDVATASGPRREPDRQRSPDRSRRSPDRSRDSSREAKRSEPYQGSRSSAEGPKERPRLKLQPRSKPLEEAGQVTVTSAIFGGAKPVDTAAREREIEDRLIRKPTSVTEKEKENRTTSDDDRHPYQGRTSVTSNDGSRSGGDEPTKRHNSGGGERIRKESSSSSQDATGKKERHAGSASSSKASRKLSTDADDGSDGEQADSARRQSKKTAAAMVAEKPPVKLVPAPPPKENIWEKRKSVNQAVKVPQPGSASVTSAAEVEEQKLSELTEKESVSDDVSEAGSSKRTESEEMIDSTGSASDTNVVADVTKTQRQLGSASAAAVTPPAAAAGPASPTSTATEPNSKVNIWDQRKKEQDSRKSEKPASAASHCTDTAAPAPVRKTATVSVAGRGGAWAAGAPKRVEVDAQSTARKNREKPVPTSIDDMPKLEEKSSKDFSSANKFAHLEDEDAKEIEEQTDD